MTNQQSVPPSISISPPQELSERIRVDVARDLKPDRGPSPPQRWLLGLGAIVATLLGVFFMVEHRAHGPSNSQLTLVAGGFALIAAATLLSLGRAGSAHVSVATRLMFALAPPAIFLLMTGATIVFGPTGGGPGHALGCSRDGALMAAAPILVLLLVWRRTDPFTPRLTGALIGGWAGLTGALGLALACPSTDVWHLLIGHGAAVLGGAALGAWLGRRLLAP